MPRVGDRHFANFPTQVPTPRQMGTLLWVPQFVDLLTLEDLQNTLRGHSIDSEETRLRDVQ